MQPRNERGGTVSCARGAVEVEVGALQRGPYVVVCEPGGVSAIGVTDVAALADGDDATPDALEPVVEISIELHRATRGGHEPPARAEHVVEADALSAAGNVALDEEAPRVRGAMVAETVLDTG